MFRLNSEPMEVEEKEFDIMCCQILSKNNIPVVTDDYVPGYSHREMVYHKGGNEYEPYDEPDDTSGTDWKTAYVNDHFTPKELLEVFKKFLTYNYKENDYISCDREENYRVKFLLKELSGRVEDDLVIEEED